MPHLFKPTQIGSEIFELMDLTHPRVEREIMNEMSQGIEVYYDVR